METAEQDRAAEQGQDLFAIRGMHHVEFYVGNAKQSAYFYGRALGFRLAGYLGPDARAVTRLPGGHPEGYIEAFAVLYREFAESLWRWKAGDKNPLPPTLPAIEAAVRGMRFIDRAIESNRTRQWVEF